jgi:hypothetical protein
LGDRIEDVTAPMAVEEMEEWLSFIGDAGSLRSDRAHFLHAISSRALLTEPAVNPQAITRSGFGLCVVANWIPAWASRNSLWLPFLAAYARELASGPPIIVEAVPGDIVSSPSSDLERIVVGLRDAGARGLASATLMDLPLAAQRSFTTREASAIGPGLLEANGRLTAAGRVLLEATNDSTPREVSLSVVVDRELHSTHPEMAARRAFEGLWS